MTRPRLRPGAMNRWLGLLCLWVVLLSCHVRAEEVGNARSQRHAKKPLIGLRYINDRDGNALEDQLEAKLDKASRKFARAVSKKDKDKAQEQLDTSVEVQFIFKSPVQQSQLDTFNKLGGRLGYLYKAVSYGWNGTIPLRKLRSFAEKLGTDLVLVEESKPIQAHLDVATSNGRVRPVWASGFAGSSNGFQGTDSITIAIVDSGVDVTHPDLQDRCVYWNDYSYDNSASPVDKYHHGSHVAGIATGTGLASGSQAGTLLYTDRSAPYLTFYENGYFQPVLVGLPDTEVTFTSTAQWFGDAPTSLYLFAKAKGINAAAYVTSEDWTALSDPDTGYAPLHESNTFTPSPDMVYTTALPANMIDWTHLIGRYVITNSIENMPGTADGFNRLSGIAPGCNWAGSKVFTKDGIGQANWLEAAVDDLVINRVDKNIKVMNLSVGIVGTPGLAPSLRQKINTAVANGIVVVISAGNDGRNTAEEERVVDDPGRAAYAITVAASNDDNQITDYTSQGFLDPNSTAGQEEDYKPDIAAPGGSIYHSFIMSVDSNSGDGGSFTDQQSNDYTQMRGTSMASPFIAGCAALVIDALEQQDHVWDFNSLSDPMFVKMILTATASETNAPRENNIYNPSLQRAAAGPDGYPVGKDRNEGYGLVNVDAAIEAVTEAYVLDTPVTDTLGPELNDKRVWARQVEIDADRAFEPYLTVPEGADFDLYLYDAQPGLYGRPVLIASSTNAGAGVNESLSYTPTAAWTGFLVVKRVSGSGPFSLTTLRTFHQITAASEAHGSIDPNGVLTKVYGSDQVFTATPIPDYQVDHWLVDSNVVQTGGTSFVLTDITADHTVTVQFKPIVYTYTITASAGDNGSINPSGVSTLTRQSGSDVLVQKFTATADSGYTIDRWTVDGVVQQFGRQTFYLLVQGDHTVTVSFKALTYNIYAAGSSHGNLEPDGLFDKSYGSQQVFGAIPDTGYQVDTWYVDGIEAQSSGAMYTLSDITAPHTVEVSFAQKLTCGILASAGDGGSIDPNMLVTVPFGGDQLFVAAPQPGYTIDRWLVDGVAVQFGRTNFWLIGIQDDLIVEVLFRPITYTLNADAGPHGTVEPDGLTTTVAYGSDQLFIAAPDAGYTVDAWFVDGAEVQSGGLTYTLSAITASHTVAVYFMPLPVYTITVSAEAGGRVEPDGVLTKEPGAEQVFTAMPDAGYTVDAWFVDGAEVQSGGLTYTLSEIADDHTVTVRFAPLPVYYTITMSAEAGGRVDPNGVIMKEPGAEQAFTATPDAGYQVDAWWLDGMVAQSGGLSFLLSEIADDHSLTVTFSILPLRIDGYFTDPNGIPVEGIQVQATNGAGSDTTDPNGYYLLRVDYGWSGRVDPNQTGYLFDPNSRTYENLTANQHDDYTAIPQMVFITGYVIDADTLTPLADVLVTPEQEGGLLTRRYVGGGSCLTDQSGYYTVWVDYDWSGTVTLSKDGYLFEPQSTLYTHVTEDRPEQPHYLGIVLSFTISGTVTSLAGTPVEGVEIGTTYGAVPAITDPNGFYQVWVASNWSGTLIPEKADFIIDPNRTEFVNVMDDLESPPYTARSIYDLDASGWIDLADVAAFGDQWLQTGPGRVCDYHPDDDNIINFLDFAEFSRHW